MGAALLLFSGIFSDCFPEDIKATIISDTLEYNPADNTYTFFGNVVIKRDNTTFKADKIIYHIDDSLFRAYGNIDYSDKDISIHALEGELNLETKQGSLSSADIIIKKNEYSLSGEKTTFSSGSVYTVENAAFTTCDPNDPAWCFYAKKADIKINDSMELTDVIFKVGGLPSIYYPDLTVSLKRRKSGFLMPVLGYNNDKGFYGSLPYYLVISSNRDATFTLEDYSKRGVGEGLEYRYIERGGIEGTWNVHHLYDKVIGKDLYTVVGEQKYFSQGGLSSDIKVDFVNTDDFYKEYSQGFDTLTKRYSFSDGDISYSNRHTRAYLFSEYAIDLNKYDANVYQKLPELGYVINPVTFGPAFFSFAGSISDFVSFTSPNVERLIMSPGFSNSFGDSLRFTQNAGVMTAMYSNTLNNNANNNLFYSPWLSERINFSLMKDYGNFIHIIEPTLGYRYSMKENNAATLDSFELIDKVSILEFSLINQFIDSQGMFMMFILSSPYDLNNNITPFSPFKFSLFFDRPISIKADMSVDYYTGDLISANSQTFLKFNYFDFSIGERFNRINEILFLSLGAGFNISKSLRLETRTWYDIENGDLKYVEVETKYSTKCMGLNLLVRTAPNQYSFYVMFELKGIGMESIKAL